MTKFDELKERFPNLIPVQELRANVSIIELAVQWGYEPQLHKGKARPVLEHPGYKDTIIIKNPQDAGHQVYQRAGDFSDAGTIIDFIRNRLSTVFSTFNRPGQNEFKNITNVLYDYLRIDPDLVKQNRKVNVKLAETSVKQPFTKEQFDIRPLEKDNYLLKRHIAPQTLQRPEFAGKVVSQITYFDSAAGHADPYLTAKEHPERKYLTFSNVAFPYYNGQSTDVTGLELRNEQVKLHAPGSDRTSSVFVSNPPAKTEHFYVMESAIDALSHRQLRSIDGDDTFNAVYFSTGGQLTPQQVNTMTRYIGSFEKADNWHIHLCFDNDTKGHQYDLQFIQQLTAVKFPMASTVAGTNRVAYLLPEQETYRSTRDVILERIELYNKDVQAQFSRSDSDTLGQKELASQLITVSRANNQVQISIPEACAPLSAFTKLLLEVTGLDQRIKLDKACTKDFNQDLSRDIKVNEKFTFTIKDETGKVLIMGNSPAHMNRSMQHLKHQAETDGLTKSFVLTHYHEYGFSKPLVNVNIERGICIKSTQTNNFNELIQQERSQRNKNLPSDEARQPKQALNPESKPQLAQQSGSKPHLKQKRE